MLDFEQYLHIYGLKSLSVLHIKICYHKTLPLIILTYDNIRSPKNNPIVTLCRGLVVELETFKIISCGMSRFDKINDNNKTKLIQAEIKEDGTLLHIFNYKGTWLLSTKHNFADDYLDHNQTQTYKDLFENICGYNLEKLCENLDPNITYCLEMCSLNNRIIRKYETSVIYLLACYQNGIELSNNQSIETQKIGWIETKKYLISDINDCYNLLKNQISLFGPLFEGLIIRDINKDRHKLKNPFYLQLHTLKYRSWRLATSKNIVPLLINHSDKLDLIYEALSHNHTQYDMIEYRKRIEDSEIKLHRLHLDNIPLTIQNYINKYGRQDPFIDNKHDKKYCTKEIIEKIEYNDGLATNTPVFKDGIWCVECYCGTKMFLHRTKTDYLIYNICQVHNCNFNIKVYPTGTLIWLCTECSLTHDAYQYDGIYNGLDVIKGQPMGIPCSSNCNNLRLTIHQLFRDQKSIEQTYKLLRDELKISTYDSDIPTCTKTIQLLNNIV